MLDEYAALPAMTASSPGEDRCRAARLVASKAVSAEDAAALLAVLGLTAADGLDRTEATA
jgi:hypothetical protein